jgi:hypothetical protein
MSKVILNTEAIKNLEQILGEIPFKWSAPIMNILNQNFVAETTEETKPIGGGGGGPVKPPKNE